MYRYSWELKSVLLRRHTQPSLLAYSEETATVMRNLDCDLVGRCTLTPPDT